MVDDPPIEARIRRASEFFAKGMSAASDGVDRQTANMRATWMPIEDGDAYLAGYYAELRRLRFLS